MDTKSTIKSIVTDLLDNNACKSLQIIPERSGSSLVKLRLVGDNLAEKRSNFKLKNDTQVNRDFNRSKIHHSGTADDNEKPSRNRKQPDRYTDDRNLVIENPRLDNLEDQSLTSILTSPVGSVATEPCMADDSLLNVSSPRGLNESVNTDVNSNGSSKLFAVSLLDSYDITSSIKRCSDLLASITDAVSQWPESIRNSKSFNDHCFKTLSWSLDLRHCYYCDRKLDEVIKRIKPPKYLVDHGWMHSDEKDGRMAYCALCQFYFCSSCMNHPNHAIDDDGCQCETDYSIRSFLNERVT